MLIELYAFERNLSWILLPRDYLKMSYNQFLISIISGTNNPERLSLTCRTCGIILSSLEEYNKHINIVHWEWECSICGKIFTTNSGHFYHMRLHKADSTTECSICKRVCPSTSHLVRHMKVHSTTKEFKCSTCGKTYKYRYDLQRHKKICRWNPQDVAWITKMCICRYLL